LIPPEGTSPVGDGPPSTPEAPPPPGRPGSGTFTIEGRQAPALFVIGWLASLLGLGFVFVGVLSGGGPASPFILAIGLVLLSVGLIAGAGSQGIERRARGTAAYQGPSPFLVFGASIPISLLLIVIIGVPLALVGIDVQGPLGAFASIIVQTLVYVGLIRLLVVDTGALDWAAMGLRRFDRAALTELVAGALWAVPVILVTNLLAAILLTLLPVTPVSPLPPSGSDVGFVLNLLAAAVVAPIGEELLFRGFATTAWARDLGARRAIVQGALFFAIVHVLTIGGVDAAQAFGVALIAFVSRIPVALVLGWLFLRRGSIWAPIGLHAAFNGLLVILAEFAIRSGIV
jgi:membrane protease YdiL (CAAX protease family)